MLFGIFLDELFEDILADQRERLLLEVLGFASVQSCHCFGLLFLEFGHCFCRCGDTPHLIEGVHVERKIVEFSPIVGYRTVGISVELDDGIHKVPHLLVGGMEDVCTILVHIDSLDVFAINIASHMRALVNDQTFLACLSGEMGKCGTVEAGTDNEEIVLFHIFLYDY